MSKKQCICTPNEWGIELGEYICSKFTHGGIISFCWTSCTACGHSKRCHEDSHSEDKSKCATRGEA